MTRTRWLLLLLILLPLAVLSLGWVMLGRGFGTAVASVLEMLIALVSILPIAGYFGGG